MRGFSRFLIDEQPLYVLPTLACVVGLPEAIFLQQLHHWCTSKFAHEHGGRHWVYNSYPEWNRDHFPFWNPDAIKRIVRELEKRGVVLSATLSAHKTDRRKWYTIDYERLDALCEAWIAENRAPAHQAKSPDHPADSPDVSRRASVDEPRERTHRAETPDGETNPPDHETNPPDLYKGDTETTTETIDRGKSSSIATSASAERADERDVTWLRRFIGDFAAQFGDEAALPVSLARAGNLWLRSGLDEDAFTGLLYEARQITLRRTPGIERRREGEERKNKMPYFFQVLEGLLAGRRGDST